MNKILFIIKISIIFISINARSQEIATTDSGKKVQLFKNGTYKILPEEKKVGKLTSKDFKTLEDQVRSVKNVISQLNGDEKEIDVKFSFIANSNVFSNLNIETINSMIGTANTKTMFKMKNRRTYIPKEISFYYSDDKENWFIVTEYTAQNDYGATKDGRSYTLFDVDGNFKDILIN